MNRITIVSIIMSTCIIATIGCATTNLTTNATDNNPNIQTPPITTTLFPIDRTTITSNLSDIILYRDGYSGNYCK